MPVLTLFSGLALVCIVAQGPSPSPGPGDEGARKSTANASPPPEAPRFVVAFTKPEALETFRERGLPAAAGEILEVEPIPGRKAKGRDTPLATVAIGGDAPPKDVLVALRAADGVEAALPARKNLFNFVVRFQDKDTKREAAAEHLREVGLLTLRPTFGARNLYEAIVVTDDDLEKTLGRLRALKGVATADPNYTYRKLR